MHYLNSGGNNLNYDNYFAVENALHINSKIISSHKLFVQTMWCSLEGVMIGVDTASLMGQLQLPAKNWTPCFSWITCWIFIVEHWNLRQCVSIDLCDISIFWPFCTFEYLDLLRETWILENHFPWIGYTHIWRKCYHISVATTLNWKWGFLRNPIENLFFTQHLSTHWVKKKNPFGKAHTGSFTVWCEAWSFWNTYLKNNLGKTRVLFFCFFAGNCRQIVHRNFLFSRIGPVSPLK